MDRSLVRDTAVVGAAYLAVLVAIGTVLALVGGTDPAAYLADLFTDPLWLLGIPVGLYFGVTGYRRTRRQHGEA
ncbi:hypothetical protein [Candidatus Halobonum tyrrellensis]|uniref:Uncharacterized protein n=1 Tax=Candidatus Halobonum tyrrellensis G22 TaxID=1324957 RepID=V4HF71_9EURY|nr:hypothetical protein [Candidatus Halobonum tyrrellensis]ESP89315.1 hypothetical protein K933_04836 [Candidatus Halobonum tyrrellensis G22]